MNAALPLRGITGRVASLFLGLSMIGLGAACNKSEETPAPAPAPSAETGTPADPNTILIGHYASMTGSEATFGVSTDNGIKLAVEERNAAGGVKGKQIKVITYDDQGKAQEAGTAVTRLIDQDKVTAILGEVASSRSLAGAPICQKKGVPMISPSSTNQDVTAIGDMISRVCFIDPFQGYVGAKFAKENLNFSKGATLYNRAQAYSSGLNTNFKDAFAKLGGQVVSEQAYSDGDNDFHAQLTSIREAKPDFIYVPGYYTEVVNIARQAKSLGLNIPLIGGDGWDSEDLKNAGDALNGCYYSNHYSQEDKSPAVQDFIKKYQAKFGKIPDGLAALGYDAARLLFDAMDRAKQPTPAEVQAGVKKTGGTEQEVQDKLYRRNLADSINSTKNFAGVTGTITIDAQRNATKDAVMLEVVNGVPKYKATIKPE
jgi:branched-chain amino acid transport system substrate-binding protein